MGEVEAWRLLVPPWYDALWTVTATALVLLWAGALTLWVVRRRLDLHGLVDLVLILVVPVLGPLAYLLGELVATLRGRRARRASGAPGALSAPAPAPPPRASAPPPTPRR